MPDRRTVGRTLGAASLAVLGWGAWRWSQPDGPPAPPPLAKPPAPTTAAPRPSARPAPWTGPVLRRSVPVRLAIPKIRLEAFVDAVGLTRDGRVETPSYAQPTRAAWYRYGPTPGEPGPAVILGHVDSKSKVAVFFYLTRLTSGAAVEIGRADGSRAVFTVESVERFAKTAFPTERVYAGSPVPQLRLVTCGGQFDRRRQEYLDNVIVFARLTGVTSAASTGPGPGGKPR
ncbi:class F sortase [Longispora sp. K20-0274]|uniref:class F sortase n=1 Tax=Longispora sp. K20-0274 TaxID=3088255 RepID=UPI003999873C